MSVIDVSYSALEKDMVRFLESQIEEIKNFLESLKASEKTGSKLERAQKIRAALEKGISAMSQKQVFFSERMEALSRLGLNSAGKTCPCEEGPYCDYVMDENGECRRDFC